MVETISLLANPNQIRPTRFWGVYTKLKIFNMTNYQKVVYLDADTIVVKDIADLFKCSKFCANLKHSGRLISFQILVSSNLVYQRKREIIGLYLIWRGYLTLYNADVGLYMLANKACLFCRNSVYEHIRYLHYKIRSNGELGYNGVSSSLPISYTQQCKFPACLGGLPIAALTSLPFSMAIMPHQVMPWTGLLLMYEWTFTFS